MKKIAFVTSLENYGGTEKSLIRLLNAIPQNRYDVTILPIGKIGEIASEIPDWICIRKVFSRSMKRCLIDSLKEKNWIAFIKYIFNLLTRKIYLKKSFYRYELALQQYEQIEGKYDVVICWSLPNSWETVFSLTKVDAYQKWLWIHMDVSSDKQPDDALKYFKKYNRIFCVSKACKSAFDNCYPECAEKTKVFYNIIDVDEITNQGKKSVEMDCKSAFSIVTCGRLSSEKQPQLAIEIMRRLLESGYKDLKWYFVGDGLLKQEMLNKIKENNLEEHIILLGKKYNPCAYVSKGDLYVQMSVHESFCMTLAEAQILGIPTITTNFLSAYEIVQNNITGFIVHNDSQEIGEKIEYLYNNRTILKQMRSEMNHMLRVPVGNIELLFEYLD